MSRDEDECGRREKLLQQSTLTRLFSDPRMYPWRYVICKGRDGQEFTVSSEPQNIHCSSLLFWILTLYLGKVNWKHTLLLASCFRFTQLHMSHTEPFGILWLQLLLSAGAHILEICVKWLAQWQYGVLKRAATFREFCGNVTNSEKLFCSKKAVPAAGHVAIKPIQRTDRVRIFY